MDVIFQNIIEYIKSICFYLVVSSFLINMVPNENMAKYVRFFMGILLIVFILRGIMDNNVFLNIEKFEQIIDGKNFETEIYEDIDSMKNKMLEEYMNSDENKTE